MSTQRIQPTFATGAGTPGGGTLSEANLMTGGGHGTDSQGAATMEARPFAIPSKKLVMWLFIISDAVTFGAMLFAYGYLKNASPNWPAPFKFYPSIFNALVMTFVLVSSSLTMLIAVRHAKTGEKRKAIRWTYITAAGGILFAVLHLSEWTALRAEGVHMFSNPWGSPMFGATFYAITGLHLTHVLGGVIALSTLAIRYGTGRYTADDLELGALYWHFVDLVWMFVVPMVYLMNIAR